jgi:hypothetical protein
LDFVSVFRFIVAVRQELGFVLLGERMSGRFGRIGWHRQLVAR